MDQLEKEGSSQLRGSLKCLLFTISIFCFGSPLNSAAQNLVPNPSFEQLDSCPSDWGQYSYVQYWFNPTMTSPDIFAECASDTTVGIPINEMGKQDALHGQRYSGLSFYTDGTDFREYIEVELVDSLITDSTYCLRYWVSLSEISGFGVNKHAAHFSSQMIYEPTNSTSLPLSSDIISHTILTDTADWILVEGVYKAQGGEKFLVLGSFVQGDSIDTVIVNQFGSASSYYYVDSVSLERCDPLIDTTQGDFTNDDEVTINFYPIPAGRSVNLSYSVGKQFDPELHLFDVRGRRVHSSNLPGGKGQITLFLDLQAGVYLWSIVSNDSQIKHGKIVIR